MNEQNTVKGYKVFDPDWTCRGFQYQVGECYEIDEMPVVCEKGFHFCEKLIDCYDYYSFDENNKVAEIIAYGDIDIAENEKKICTNKIKIERKINWNEVLAIVNTGKNCTGLGNIGNDNSGNDNSGDGNRGNRNSGDGNSGNRNSGDGNSGNRNSGDGNRGDGNSGNHNSGYRNSGNCNIGNYNSGNYNSGHCNNGYCNIGNYNSGNHNSGNHNNGYCNIGNYNSGNYNTGDCNTGDYNTGNWNTGDCNTGNWNTGDWNTGNWNTGCFNTVEQKIFLFNKLSDWTMKDWKNSEARSIFYDIRISPVQKINKKDMTEKEKEQHPEYQTTGFYLKELRSEEIAEERQKYWNQLSQEQKNIVMAIPNFDKEIFKEITGIDVDKGV